MAFTFASARRGLWALFLIASTAGYAQTTGVSLNGTWRLALGSNVADIERLSRFYQSGFDEAGFRPIPVPSNWSLQGFEEPAYGRLKPTASEGFYVHTFQAPAGFRGKRVLLHFDGVWQSAEVWLNGQPLGRHDSGFTAFAFDISKVVVPGNENRLAVRVRQFTKDYLFDTNDDW